MSGDLRGLVVAAIDRATATLNRPDLARELAEGRDIAFDRLEMDSLSLFEVVMEIEDQLGLELDADEVIRQGSVDGLVAYLGARVGAG